MIILRTVLFFLPMTVYICVLMWIWMWSKLPNFKIFLVIKMWNKAFVPLFSSVWSELFFSIQLDHRRILALISKLLFSYTIIFQLFSFTQPIMVEFALHCGAYPLCQVCVRKPACQLLGKKSSQLAALSEIWRCLFRTEILGCELVHKEGLGSSAHSSWLCDTAKSLVPSCPASPQAIVCVRRDAVAPSSVCHAPAAALGRPSSLAVIRADRKSVV